MITISRPNIGQDKWLAVHDKIRCILSMEDAKTLEGVAQFSETGGKSEGT